ncbi:DUF971 family protein [Oceanospirillum multiglobuliferum]|uniref:1-(5-phosphoribosyl)-5-((5-phosphoribosylamino)methylideneamino)imidazole-4-carboxamide isomerase n=1 Tax=Oceanospirillum multiglobuliferum TaxID=64969 RepID=A0A1T4S2T0_9GAMM|nr:DUF971 domain-containing protein [Oceanospirillum multiglobuliferum]OPX54487.1 1-(5-phosphoribosyl)-5-((5-phosphoribosylamino)methylideneamino)imidazole-4-carboxamide isomerase [Oceanospirillum multiglobuliferum]SKA22482.1 DUF971 family protein [Oceanospirillum multiglobuliferum]
MSQDTPQTTPSDAPQLVPTDIKYRKKSNLLALTYADGTVYELEAEFLRVYSPSAEVKGHGEGSEVLQVGKKYVAIQNILPAGSYAIKIIFDDGHDSGLYSWDYLYEIGRHKEVFWQGYLKRLAEANASREPKLISIKQL